MKPEWNKKYTTIAVYACATGFIVVLIVFMLINFGAVINAYNAFMVLINPIVIGFIIAYLLNPLFKWCEATLFSFVEQKKPHFKLRRALAIISSYLIVIIVITLFILFIVPQIISSYNQLWAKVNTFASAVLGWFDEIAGEEGFLRDQYEKLLEYADPEKLRSIITGFINDSFDVILSGTSYLFGFFGNVLNQVKNIVLGIVFSIYFLVSKERIASQLRKLLYAITGASAARRVQAVLKRTDETFGGFIIAKMIDSLIIGLLTFIVLGLFNMPYYPLVSVIIGLTNVIPFFGPIIGAIPSAFIIFVADPVKALWFIIIIIIIQQLDGNVIGPKIVGTQTGLSSLGVIVAITFMGGIMGLTGMFIGVPLFAVIYALVKEAIENRLREKGLAVKLDAYYESKDNGGNGDPNRGGTADGNAESGRSFVGENKVKAENVSDTSSDGDCAKPETGKRSACNIKSLFNSIKEKVRRIIGSVHGSARKAVGVIKHKNGKGRGEK